MTISIHESPLIGKVKLKRIEIIFYRKFISKEHYLRLKKKKKEKKEIMKIHQATNKV